MPQLKFKGVFSKEKADRINKYFSVVLVSSFKSFRDAGHILILFVS